MFVRTLRGDQSQYRLTDKVPYPVLSLSPGLEVDYANQQVLNLFNLQADQILGQRIDLAIPNIFSQGEIESIITTCLGEGKPFRINTRQVEILRADRSPIVWLDAEFEPLLNEDHKVDAVACFFKDVTPERIELASITSWYDYLNHFFKVAPIAIVCYRGPDFIVDVANEHALAMWGKTLEEVKGRPVEEIFPQIKTDPMIRQKHLEGVERMLRGERHLVSEVELVFHRDGSQHTGWYRYIHEPYTDAFGNVIGTMAIAIEITDQVIARKKLQLITDSLPSLISYIDSKLQYTFVNKAYEQWFGVTTESIHGKKIIDVIGSAAYDSVSVHINKALSGIADHFEGWLDYKNAGKKYITARYIPHINEAQTLLGFICVVNDLTEKKLQEENLHETGERLQLVTDAINAGTFEFDIENQVIHWSSQLKKLFGVPDDTVVTLDLSLEIVHPDDRSLVIPKVDATRGTPDESYVAVDYRIIRKDTGEIRWMHTRTKTYYRKIKDNIQAVRILGFCIDITESKATEERLREFNRELEEQVEFRTQEQSRLNRVLAEAQKVSKLGSWEWDVSTGQIVWSDEMFAIYGYDEKFVVDFNRATERMTVEDSEFSRKRTQEFIRDAVDRFSLNGSRTFDMPPLEYKIRLPDGYEKILRNSGKIYLTAEGKLEKIFGAVQDVTDIRLTEHQLQIAIEKLEEKNKDLEAFSYIASHDLKEPLRKILTFTSRLKHGNSEPIVDYAARIKGAAERMMDLIESVLTFSQMSNSEIELTDVDLNKVFENCKSDLELRIRETEATVTSRNLGVIRANLSQMNQLFSNLVGNSLKFSKEKPEVEVHLERVINVTAQSKSHFNDQSHWCLTFSDNGIGFDPEYRQQIFEPFKRLHGRETYGGTGIGLSIVKKIVERHKGMIEVESAPGKGSKFTIFLPV